MFENEPDLFWKNFRLGTELQISGSFIYNALQNFDKLRHFYYEHEIFEFLYNSSVGIERLLKICIVLLEHNPNMNQEIFEKTLITHNHIDLLSRIKKHREINFGKTHNKFLDMLAKFYKSTRYDRFNLRSVLNKPKDKSELIKFLESELNISIHSNFINITPNSQRIKDFIGKILNKISRELYQIIFNRSYELKIFTYEISHDSKASKVFMTNDYNFEPEKMLQREIFINYNNQKEKTELHKFVSNLKCLDLLDYDLNTYLQFMFDIESDRKIYTDLEEHYKEMNISIKLRKIELNAIGNEFSFEKEEE